MRKKNTLNKGWMQKTFRIRDEAINIYKFLEFYGSKNNIPKSDLFDIIVNYSLDLLENNDLHYIYKDLKNLRTVKGFTFTENTKNRLLQYCKEHSEYKIGENIEIIIGIYSLKHLPEDDLSKLDLYIKLL